MSESDQLKRVMEAPIERPDGWEAPDVGANYAGMVDEDLLKRLRRDEIGNVVDISDARSRRDQLPVPDDDSEEREAEAG